MPGRTAPLRVSGNIRRTPAGTVQSSLARCDRDQVGDGVGERSAGIELMGAFLSEERHDLRNVSQDFRSFHRSLPVTRSSFCVRPGQGSRQQAR